MSTLHVCFLWHMHQPSYTDPVTGEVVMPWVRLHGVKDYTDMAALLDEVEDARVTFNFVPGLLDQIERAAVDDGADDRFLRLTLTAPEDLDDHDRAFIARWFFSLHHPTLLEPLPRYRELRDAVDGGATLDDDQLRDLQLLFSLAWCGAAVRRDPVVAALLDKGRGFDEQDKRALIAAQRRALGEIVGRYRALAEAGRVELTCTPHEHPILPLLVDSDLAVAAHPAARLPRARFRWPGDARAHVRRALDSHASRFGAPPRGMWPAEGSVAAAILPILRDAGVEWAVSDEEILRKSLGQPTLARRDGLTPWQIDGVTLFFRDHGLSDRIGFDYARRTPSEAAEDFVADLVRAREALDGADGVITIALDGENCWEHYEGGSSRFLPVLYRAVAETEGLRLSTFGEALEAVPPRPLPRLAAGSWIDGTFATWIGDPVKNRAWELLAATREAVAEPFDAVEARDPELAALILKAEASDWWWWFGAGHSTPFDASFDALFRAHLTAIHRRLGQPPPSALSQPVSAPREADHDSADRPRTRAPVRQIRPTIDGTRGWYFKWHSAGTVAPVFGAIHRGGGLVSGLTYANDDATLSLRIDLRDPPAADALAGRRLQLRAETATEAPVLLWPPIAGVDAAAGEVFECRVDLSALRVGTVASPLRCRVEVLAESGELLECFPAVGWADLDLLTRAESGANAWI